MAAEEEKEDRWWNTEQDWGFGFTWGESDYTVDQEDGSVTVHAGKSETDPAAAGTSGLTTKFSPVEIAVAIGAALLLIFAIKK